MTTCISDKNKDTSPSPKIVIRFSLYFLGFFLLLLRIWLTRTFGDVTFEQILYHAKFGMEGIFAFDRIFIYSFIKWCFLVPLGISISIVISEKKIRRKKVCYRVTDIDSTKSTGKNFYTTPHRKFGSIFLSSAPTLLIIATLAYFSEKVSGFEYIASNFGVDYFSSHYIAPEKTTLIANKPKNLVLIYIESLDAAYADEKRFGKDLLSDINGLGGVSFAHYTPAPGTG